MANKTLYHLLFLVTTPLGFKVRVSCLIGIVEANVISGDPSLAQHVANLLTVSISGQQPGSYHILSSQRPGLLIIIKFCLSNVDAPAISFVFLPLRVYLYTTQIYISLNHHHLVKKITSINKTTSNSKMLLFQKKNKRPLFLA